MVSSETKKEKESPMNDITVLGIDLAKDVFQLHGVNEHGKKVLGKKLSRAALPNFIANLPPCKIAMEACGSANYWSRKFMSYGHAVSQISPQHVKPFVQGNKNDKNDARAIVIASQQDDMPTVSESMKHGLVHDKPVSEKALSDAIEYEKKSAHLYTAFCDETRQTLLTTPWLLSLEAETLARIEQNKGVISAISTKGKVLYFQKQRSAHLKHPMTTSQKEALMSILTSKDRYLAIQGYAGVAKTTMLAEANIFMQAQGFKVRGLTVASSAANEMQAKAKIDSDVFPLVHQELKNAKDGSLSKTIFVVDEASMLSSPQGHELIKHIERTQSRLILIGDKAQLPSVKNGKFSEQQKYFFAREPSIQTTDE